MKSSSVTRPAGDLTVTLNWSFAVQPFSVNGTCMGPNAFAIVMLDVPVTVQLVAGLLPGTGNPSSIVLNTMVEPVGILLPFKSDTVTVTAVKVFVPTKGTVAFNELVPIKAWLVAKTTWP